MNLVHWIVKRTWLTHPHLVYISNMALGMPDIFGRRYVIAYEWTCLLCEEKIIEAKPPTDIQWTWEE